MHALHVIVALLWTFVFLLPLLFHEITAIDVRRLSCLRMLWQFIAILWGFIFTIIYLIGAL
jgi:cytochrome o ubiquinol oxidase subunit 3